MSEFMYLDANAPATLQAVVEAVARLSTLGEAQILELVSEGRLSDLFPFRPRAGQDVPPDFVSEENLVQASEQPRSRQRQRAHIESSMPSPNEAAAEKGETLGNSSPDAVRKRSEQIP